MAFSLETIMDGQLFVTLKNSRMMPNMKASDFDYIIFDMPPLDQTSPTWGMAAFMDKLLLVVEAEKNSRDVIKRSYGKLIAERNNVAVVVNKSRSYVPKWLDSES